MVRLLNSIGKLMRSAGYFMRDSFTNRQVNNYFKARYPSQMKQDATGRYISDDMNVIDEQTFRKIRNEIESNNSEIEDAIAEYEEDGYEVNYTEDTEYFNVIDSNGNIREERVDVISFEEDDVVKLESEDEDKKYVWRAEGGDPCDECAELDGQEFDSLDEVPEKPHPNCQCTVEEVDADDVDDGDDKGQPKLPMSKPIKAEPTKSKSNYAPAASVSKKGLDFLKQHEGIKGFDRSIGKYMPYEDPVGLPTIGYGHLIKPDEDFSDGLTSKEVNDLLANDISTAENLVRNTIETPLSQNQFDALTSLAFNIKPESFVNSTAVKYINDSEYKSKTYPTTESAWKAFIYAGKKPLKGLINRRNDEWKLFTNID